MRLARSAAGCGLALACTVAAAQQRCDADSSRLSSPTERFEDNGDGTVTDKRMKLMWMRCSAGQTIGREACAGDALRMDWTQAQSHAAQVNQRGSHFFSDWRLPLLRELATITEARCTNPRVNLTVFPGTPGDFYWSSSARPGDTSQAKAYGISFGGEGVELLDKQETHHVRLVRSAQ